MAEDSTSNATPRFQFSIATAFCFITAVAILCFLGRLERTFPHWTLLPGTFLVAACWAARRRESPDLAWSLLAIAWLIASIQVVECLIECFSVLSGSPPASELQRGFVIAYVSNVALPLFLSLPAVYFAIRGSHASRSYARKWIILCSIVAFVDVTVITIWLVVFIGYTWPW
jgi:hypothetical protein